MKVLPQLFGFLFTLLLISCRSNDSPVVSEDTGFYANRGEIEARA